MTILPPIAFLGLQEGALILIAVIIFFLFGAKKLPQLARSTGQSVGEFKKGLKEGVAEEQRDAGQQREKDSSSDGDASRN